MKVNTAKPTRCREQIAEIFQVLVGEGNDQGTEPV
jgi:hypothetical protein